MAGSENTTTLPVSRRHLLGRAVAVATLGAAGAASAATVGAIATTVPPSDPLVSLYRQYKELDAACVVWSDRGSAIRERLVSRWGEIPMGSSGDVHWALDPELPDLEYANDLSDDYNRKAGEVQDEILSSSATTADGALVKVQAALDGFPSLEKCDEWGYVFAHGVLKDLERFLLRVSSGSAA